jgi:hypothetical protein
MSRINPDRPCPHETFGVTAEINRIVANESAPESAPVAFSADIKVRCEDCGESFRWIGLQAGMNPRRPMVSLDETELRAPLRPASADPDFGPGIPGFAIGYRPGPPTT